MKIQNPAGLSFEFQSNGNIKSIQADPIRISLKAATPFSEPGTNLYLRKRDHPFKFTALLGPKSNGQFNVAESCYQAVGSWEGIEYSCTLQLSEHSLSWQWITDILNTTTRPIEIDLIYVQDIGLKPITAGLINEYYVAQYLERRILQDESFGDVICCRQNMNEPTGHPWLMIACKNGGNSASTDGMQFYGKTCRQTGIPEGLLTDCLGGEYAGESSVIALQEKPFVLTAGESHKSQFAATYLPDHPSATTIEDLERLPGMFMEFGTGTPSQSRGTPSQFNITLKNLFNPPSFLPVEDLNDQQLLDFFGKVRRHSEIQNGWLLSFFNSQNNHIVLREKEILADRPHGHIMQAKSGLAPDEGIMSTTAWMSGIFNSHLTQGNTNFNVLLSINTSQFNLSRESGQRIFVEIDGQNYLLGVPSAFEMGLNHCRWIYKHGRYCFQVRTWTSKIAPQVNTDFKVLNGGPVNLIITHDFDPLNEWEITSGSTYSEALAMPKPGSMIQNKFPDARFRLMVQDEKADFTMDYGKSEMESHKFEMESLGIEMESLFTVKANKTSGFCISIIGEVSSGAVPAKFPDPDLQFATDCRVAWTEWKDLSLNLQLISDQEDLAAIRQILPWYGMNALVHFLTPYGLEQFGGAAWGTRDVAQGPVDLLLTMEKYEEARKVLCLIFSNQNPDGGWPQWWMFDSYHNIRAHEAHGDIFYWGILALSSYIKVTGDLAILEEVLPYYHQEGPGIAEKTPLSEHVDRLLKMITDSFIPGTSLVPFGGGDWNDSLQPVSRELAGRLISSWTVEMNHQAFSQYQQVFLQAHQPDKAALLSAICDKIKSDFNKYLVRDGVIAGYGLVENDSSISVLLHPRDARTGIKYSILPMERGILSGIFEKEQAEYHLELIDRFLKGPDGARLMDRPLPYRGGIQTIFQRAESSTFFGREVGLMYVHEHIRYAEALARMGRAEAFVAALRQAIPVGYRNVVPSGDIRQANCYYSSSDVHFKNRYEAVELYDEIKTGNMTLRGGWRVYSSGPGIYISLVVSRLLGIRIEKDKIILDPVMPESFDGLQVSIDLMDYPVTISYSVKENNFSPKAISINGIDVPFALEENKYRKGGALIMQQLFKIHLDDHENRIEIRL